MNPFPLPDPCNSDTMTTEQEQRFDFLSFIWRCRACTIYEGQTALPPGCSDQALISQNRNRKVQPFFLTKHAQCNEPSVTLIAELKIGGSRITYSADNRVLSSLSGGFWFLTEAQRKLWRTMPWMVLQPAIWQNSPVADQKGPPSLPKTRACSLFPKWICLSTNIMLHVTIMSEEASWNPNKTSGCWFGFRFPFWNNSRKFEAKVRFSKVS